MKEQAEIKTEMSKKLFAIREYREAQMVIRLKTDMKEIGRRFHLQKQKSNTHDECEHSQNAEKKQRYANMQSEGKKTVLQSMRYS